MTTGAWRGVWRSIRRGPLLRADGRRLIRSSIDEVLVHHRPEAAANATRRLPPIIPAPRLLYNAELNSRRSSEPRRSPPSPIRSSVHDAWKPPVVYQHVLDVDEFLRGDAHDASTARVLVRELANLETAPRVSRDTASSDDLALTVPRAGA